MRLINSSWLKFINPNNLKKVPLLMPLSPPLFGCVSMSNIIWFHVNIEEKINLKSKLQAGQ